MKIGIYKALLTLVCSCCLGAALSQGTKTTVVIYSSNGIIEDTLFHTIIEGIENQLGQVDQLEIEPNVTNVQALLNTYHPNQVIALDPTAADLAYHTSYRSNTIAGLFPFPPNQYNGVSLTLKNNQVAQQLFSLAPAVKRLFIIQEEGFQTINGDPEITLNGRPVKTSSSVGMLSTARLLGGLIENELGEGDAVVIPPNLPDDFLFKAALTAWEKKIMLISTNMAHLDNGAMLVFFANARALGEQLGAMVSRAKPGYETIRTIAMGLNRRTAQHLGYDYGLSAANQFEVVIK